MPAHPVSRLVGFTLAVGTSVIIDHLGDRRPTVHPVRESRPPPGAPEWAICGVCREPRHFGFGRPWSRGRRRPRPSR